MHIACEKLENVDEALLRPGRLDKHISLSLPDFDTRVAVLKSQDQQMKEQDIERIAKEGEGKTFSSLLAALHSFKNVVNK